MKKKGFTLIELLIAMSILGILAVVAIGEFRSYQSKAKQTEAKLNLEAIGNMAQAYKSENNTYVARVEELGWRPNQVTRYRYWYNRTAAAGTPTKFAAGTDYSDPGSLADTLGFTAYAVGNIDSDPTRDTWSYNTNRVLFNVNNDAGIK